jgi:hypothetical protein
MTARLARTSSIWYFGGGSNPARFAHTCGKPWSGHTLYGVLSGALRGFPAWFAGEWSSSVFAPPVVHHNGDGPVIIVTKTLCLGGRSHNAMTFPVPHRRKASRASDHRLNPSSWSSG